MNRLIAAVAVLVLVGSSCGDDKTPVFETVLKGRSGGPKKAAEVVIGLRKTGRCLSKPAHQKTFRASWARRRWTLTRRSSWPWPTGPNASELTDEWSTSRPEFKVRARRG